MNKNSLLSVHPGHQEVRPAVVVLLLVRLDPGSPAGHHHGAVLQADAQLVRLEETGRQGEGTLAAVSGGPRAEQSGGGVFVEYPFVVVEEESAGLQRPEVESSFEFVEG